jgi:soluble lytic murein transglycosylase-like protein
MNQGAITTAALNANKYQTQVCNAAAQDGISGECSQLLGILGVESDGNPNAHSGAGAYGLMQMLPETAANNGVPACAGSSNSSPSSACVAALENPTTNIDSAVSYYASLYNHFGGDETNATAAFNAGDGTGVNSDGTKQAFAPSSDCPGEYAWQCNINPGGFTETQNYVANVAAVAKQAGG